MRLEKNRINKHHTHNIAEYSLVDRWLGHCTWNGRAFVARNRHVCLLMRKQCAQQKIEINTKIEEKYSVKYYKVIIPVYLTKYFK